jgi:hypothetical protein
LVFAALRAEAQRLSRKKLRVDRENVSALGKLARMKPSIIVNVFSGWLGNLLPKYETKPRPK